MTQKTISKSFYLIFRKTGQKYAPKLSIRTTERSPNLGSDEVPVYVTVELPMMLFEKPSLRATILVDEGATLPTVIEAKVANDIAKVIEEQLGVRVRLSVEGPILPEEVR